MSDKFCKGCGKPCHTWGRTFIVLNGDYYHVDCLVDHAAALQAVAEAAREAITELRTVAAAVADAGASGADVPETVYVKQAVIDQLAAALEQVGER